MPRAPLQIGRALRSRNYRLFFAGQGLSVTGTWITKFATSWMAYRLTGSAFVLGLVTLTGQLPTSLIAPFAGVLIDRWDRRRTLINTQIAAMLQSAALAAFALTDTMTVWLLIVLGAVQGGINAFDNPARQSFMGQMVEDRADLPNAIALNSVLVNGGRLIGPAIAAALVPLFGEGWCFAIDALTYAAVIGSLLAMRVTQKPARRRSGKVLSEMRAGLVYMLGVPLVRGALTLMACSTLLAGAYASLLPIIAATTLEGGPQTLGILMASAGCGALVSALFLASRTTSLGLPAAIGRSALVLGLALCSLEVVPSIWLAAPALFAIGLTLMLQLSATNTILQTLVEQDKLGRVMSFYTVAVFGAAPIGAFVEGSIADQIGAVHTLAAAGVLCAGSALIYVRKLPRLLELSRADYIRVGLIESPPSPAAPVHLAARPAETMSPPVDSAIDPVIQDEIDVAEFYLGEGMYAESIDVLRGLLQRSPDHERITAKLREAEALAALGGLAEEPDESAVDPTSSIAAEVGTSMRMDTEIDLDPFGLDEDLAFTLVRGPAPNRPSPVVTLQQPIDEADAATHYDLGLACREMGLHGQAISAFEKALRSPDRVVQCRLMIGLCLRESGKHSEAIEQLKHGLHAGPNERERPSLYYEIGVTYEDTGDAVEALHYFELALKRDPIFLDASERVRVLRSRVRRQPRSHDEL